MHDDPEPELPPAAFPFRKALIVIGEQPPQGGDERVEQQGLRNVIHGMDERQNAIAAVMERVAVRGFDSRGAHRRFQHAVDLLAQLFLDRIGAQSRG